MKPGLRSLRMPAAVVATVVMAVAAAPMSTGTAGAAMRSSSSHDPYTSTDTATLNIPYSSASPLDVLDVVRPVPAPRNAMAIVLIHGGGFTGGGKGVMDEAADSFVKAGWVAFNINYGLTGYPSENNDVYAAIAWVHLHAAAYGADPNAIAVLGASAGGTLAGMVATRGAAHGAAVRAVATWSGPMDIATLVDSTPAKSYAHTQPVIYVGGCLPSACPATYNAVSPLDNVTSKTSPMLLANSSNEGIPLSQAQDMDKALIAAHVPQQLDVVPGKRHATKYESVEMAPTIAFLTKYTQPTASSSTAPATSPTTSASQTTSASPTTSASKSTSASNTTRDLVIGIVAVVVVGFLVLLFSRRSRRRA